MFVCSYSVGFLTQSNAGRLLWGKGLSAACVVDADSGRGLRGSMIVTVVTGDLLSQDTDVIVNAWNRNLFPWWMLLPQGVSGAIKRRGGTAPFRELSGKGLIPLGQAVLTTAGTLPFKGIIHVAGINLLWRASERSIRDSVRNTAVLAEHHRFSSMAFPLIGSGSGGFSAQRSLDLIQDELQQTSSNLAARIVVFPGTRGLKLT